MENQKHTPTPWGWTDELSNAHIAGGEIIDMEQTGMYEVFAAGGEVIICVTDKANARRICAAINACEGVTTEALEFAAEETIKLDFAGRSDRITQLEEEIKAWQLVKEGVMQKNEEIERLRQQKAELAKSLKSIVKMWSGIDATDEEKIWAEVARAALTKYDQPSIAIPRHDGGQDVFTSKEAAALKIIFDADESEKASGGEMWYAEVVAEAIDKARKFLNQPDQIPTRTYPADSPELFISIHDIPEHLREQLQAQLSGTARKDDQPNTDKFPKSIYDAAPDMYELLQDIAYPRRGSEAETWTIEPRAAQLAIRIIADIDSDQPAPMCENCGHDHHSGQPCNFEAENDFPEKPTPTEIRNMNEYIRLREIENFLECEGLTDKFEDWYLDKQFELGAKHEPQNPADLDEF